MHPNEFRHLVFAQLGILWGLGFGIWVFADLILELYRPTQCY
jgi:hypothetical protein